MLASMVLGPVTASVVSAVLPPAAPVKVVAPLPVRLRLCPPSMVLPKVVVPALLLTVLSAPSVTALLKLLPVSAILADSVVGPVKDRVELPVCAPETVMLPVLLVLKLVGVAQLAEPSVMAP